MGLGSWLAFGPLIACVVFLWSPKRALVARFGSDPVWSAAWSTYVAFVTWGIVLFFLDFVPTDMFSRLIRLSGTAAGLALCAVLLLMRPAFPRDLALWFARLLPRDLQRMARAAAIPGAMQQSLLAVRIVGGYCLFICVMALGMIVGLVT